MTLNQNASSRSTCHGLRVRSVVVSKFIRRRVWSTMFLFRSKDGMVISHRNRRLITHRPRHVSTVFIMFVDVTSTKDQVLSSRVLVRFSLLTSSFRGFSDLVRFLHSVRFFSFCLSLDERLFFKYVPSRSDL